MDSRKDLYKIIADNIKRERERMHITQAELAEKADISVDTVKSIELGRRSMSLDSYLGIVQALETSPYALINSEQSEKYIERFTFMVFKRSESEIEFVLHMVEQLLKGQDCYLSD
ncbi:MAG: helix-turn-helix domain-containing protein [Lachnospiraceae bacterium]|nr:helix-turn-helix domain-containing protein [Lachnospiraceae bacterium]